MSSLVTAAERSVAGKITRSALVTRRSRPPASTMVASEAMSLRRGRDVRREHAPGSVVAAPGPRIAHAPGDLLARDRPADQEHDERHRGVARHPHAYVLLVQLVDLEDAGAVRLQILGLLDQPAVRPDREQLGMQEPVERL